MDSYEQIRRLLSAYAAEVLTDVTQARAVAEMVYQINNMADRQNTNWGGDQYASRAHNGLNLSRDSERASGDSRTFNKHSQTRPTLCLAHTITYTHMRARTI